MLYSICSWESVRSFHLVAHQMAINDGVDNPEHWSRINTSLESSILVKRDKSFNSSGSKQKASKGSSTGGTDLKPICFRFYKGQKC